MAIPDAVVDTAPIPAYLIVDTESVPDGTLLARVKYPGEDITPEQAIARAQEEARERSYTGSDFLPVTFQYPVAACVIRVGADFGLQSLTCLDAPHYRPRKIAADFWLGIDMLLDKYRGLKLVTFNGRGFDVPLFELAAFRFGIGSRAFFANGRKRFDSAHFDIMDWLGNFGAYRLVGGLNLLSKLLGKPGKMNVQGDQVYRMFGEGKLQEINDYCAFDTLDTFFVFVRTRVMTGEITLEQEQHIVQRARDWLQNKVADMPALQTYLDNWGSWEPWV